MPLFRSLFRPAAPIWVDRMLAAFRVVAGLMFVISGTQLLFGMPPGSDPFTPPARWSEMWVGGILQAVGGGAIVLGVWARPVAFVLAGQMAVAYFQFHAPRAFLPNNNGGIAAVLYCFFFLYVMVAGAGAWSLDAAIARAGQDD